MSVMKGIIKAMDSRECIKEGVSIRENTKECVDRCEEKTSHHELEKENVTNGEDTGLWRQRKESEGEEPIVHKRKYKDIEIEETCNDEKCMQSVSESFDDAFIDDSHDEDPFFSESDNDSHSEAPLSDTEIEELVSELLEIESKAAEAQEALESESLKQVEKEVRAELAHDLQGDELEITVSTEMRTFTEQWEMTLDELETECTLLLEQLDGAGIELSGIYKWIESQASNECSTEAWRKRTHWVGSQETPEVTDVVSKAEKQLKSCYPVRRKHGKLLEEGASGFLSKKLSVADNQNFEENSEKNWKSFTAYIQTSKDDDTKISFGSTNWASVYLASTPQQAAEMGLTFPGVDEVEEINEIPIDYCDPFYADAVANENCIDLSEKQRQNYRKIREDDDAIITKKLQNHLMRRRHKRQKHQGFLKNDSSPVDQDLRVTFDNDSSQLFSGNGHIRGEGLNNGTNSSHKLEADAFLSSESKSSIATSACRNGNFPCVSENIDVTKKSSDTIIIDSDDEVQAIDQSDSIILHQHQTSFQSCLQVKEAVGFIDVDVFVATESFKDFHCTACFEALSACKVHKHPLLNVISCEHCKLMMEGKMQNKDVHEANCYCGFCGSSNDLKNCDFCNMLFCITCIKRNLCEEQFLLLKASSWKCFCCSPTLLEKLTSDYKKARNSVFLSSSDSDSQRSDSDIHVFTSKNKKRKRKLRRILDDAELGEDTKQKIEIEKTRQDHLKSLQFSENRCRNDEASTKIMEGGDGISGYIVNIAREEDEELVRIPPCISSKLKFHQIEGIRFMWENIIQSVKKARSGDKGLGCILAHTMGLGKTFQVIGFLYSAFRSIDLGLKTAIIVAPVNVLHNWRHEFMKWSPLDVKALHVYMLEDVLRDRRLQLLSKWRKKGGVLLIGYSSFRNIAFGKHVKDKNTAREMSYALQEPDILICDEAHMIKNTRADITQALKQVRSQRRIALTGSPLQNNLMEYYCMVDFVREGFLGSSLEFRNRFQNPIENGQHTNSRSVDVKIMNQRSHILYEQLKGFVQRRDMNVVKNDLPPKTVYVISVKLSPLQRKLYKKFLDVHGFTNQTVSIDKTMRRGSFFAGYQALAQIWNHPGLLQMAKEQRDKLLREDIVKNFLGDDSSSDDNIEDGHIFDEDGQQSKNDSLHKRSDDISFHEDIDWWKDIICEKIYKVVDHSGKMVLLLDILSMSSEIGDKALIFSQSIATLDLIERFLSKLPRKGAHGKYWKHGKDWYRIDGRTKGSERQKIIESFNDSSNIRVKCTLISTRAGSLGINLHSANRVIIFDGSWNPTNDLQAIYRAWRYGQQKPVFAYRLMAHGTMEEKIYKRQVKKEGLAARVMDRQQIHRTMSKEEMLHLFDFGDDENIDSVLVHNQQGPLPSNQERTSSLSDFLKQGSLSVSKGVGLSDKFMESLLDKHHPRWIQDYHEHETLFQENEDERLSKEEQDSAMETFLRTIEWEEVQRVSDVSTSYDKKPPRNPAPSTEENHHTLQVNAITNGLSSRQSAPRKCTNLSHMLTLRSQGTKAGTKTNCGDCSQEISWENLRIGKPK